MRECLAVKYNLVFLFLDVTSGFHLAVKSVLIVDLGIEMQTTSEVFLTCRDVVKQLFLTKKRIMQPEPSFMGFLLPSLSVCSFILIWKHIVDLASWQAFAITLIDFFWFFSIIMAAFTCSDTSTDFTLIAPVKHQQNADLTLAIISRP